MCTVKPSSASLLRESFRAPAGDVRPWETSDPGAARSLLLNAYEHFAGGAEPGARYEYYADDNGTVQEASINRATELALVTGYVPGTYDASTATTAATDGTTPWGTCAATR